MNPLKDISTENNGIWYCPIRIAGMLGILVFLFLEVWQVCVKHHDLDAMSFGTAFAAIVGSYAAAITAKGRFLEGNPQDPPQNS